MEQLDLWVRGAGIIFGIAAAVFWLWGAMIAVPDNIDTFISVLQKIGRLNAVAATSAALGAICGAYLFWRQ